MGKSEREKSESIKMKMRLADERELKWWTFAERKLKWWTPADEREEKNEARYTAERKRSTRTHGNHEARRRC